MAKSTSKICLLISIAALICSAEARWARQVQSDSGLVRIKLADRRGSNGLLEPFRLVRDGQVPRIGVVPPFIGKINLGNPAQDFSVTFDTAASNLLLKSTNCWSCGPDKKSFDSSKSSTYQKDGRRVETQTWSATYKGFLGLDDLSVAGIVLKNQSLLEVTKVDELDDIRGSGYDGVFGLGFDEQAAGGVATPLTEMLRQKLISQKVVSLYENKFFRPLSHTGEIIFGGIDESKFVGNITYQTVSPGSWLTQFDEIAFKGSPNGCQPGVGCSVYLNTGSPISFGPRKDVKVLNEALGAKAMTDTETDIYVLPSCERQNFPALGFTVAGRKFSVGPESYVVSIFDPSIQDIVCISSLVGHPSQSDISYWTLGNTFIGNQYTVLDYENNRVGFATLTVT